MKTSYDHNTHTLTFTYNSEENAMKEMYELSKDLQEATNSYITQGLDRLEERATIRASRFQYIGKLIEAQLNW